MGSAFTVARWLFGWKKSRARIGKGQNQMTAGTQFISNLTIGALASVGEDGAPQVATIFFAISPDGSLIFKSRRGSDHMRSLPHGGAAAISAYGHSSSYRSKNGIQLKGTIKEIHDINEMKEAIDLYSTTFPGAGEKFQSAEEHVLPNCSSTLFKFVPVSYKLLDPGTDRSDLKYLPWQGK